MFEGQQKEALGEGGGESSPLLLGAEESILFICQTCLINNSQISSQIKPAWASSFALLIRRPHRRPAKKNVADNNGNMREERINSFDETKILRVVLAKTSQAGSSQAYLIIVVVIL